MKRISRRSLRRSIKTMLKDPLVYKWGLFLLQLAELINKKT